jgi:hypothetical protein
MVPPAGSALVLVNNLLKAVKAFEALGCEAFMISEQLAAAQSYEAINNLSCA